MRSLAWALVIGACLAASSGREPAQRVIEVSTADELREVFRRPISNVTVTLRPGTYDLAPTPINAGFHCGDEGYSGPATAGLIVSGNHIRLTGSGIGECILRTNAACGLYLNHCMHCDVLDLTITEVGGDSADVRPASAILVDTGVVTVTNCVIRDNGRAGTLAARGAMGIWATNGVDLTVQSRELVRNTYALRALSDARVTLKNNVIEGFGSAGAGNGGALLISCGAIATVERNHISALSDGITVLGRGSLECTANIIEQVHGDGIDAFDPKVGRIRASDNVFFRCGAAGIAVRAEGDQEATRNIVVECGGINPRQGAVYAVGAKSEAAARKNTLYRNTTTDPSLDRDVPSEAFWRARRPWTRTYRNTPVGVDGRHKFYESAFLTRYGRWAN